MTKYIVNKNNSPIISLMRKNKLQKSDICRLLQISQATVNNYINNPYLIRLYDLHLLASLFNIGVLELVLLLDRNKPTLTKENKWYLEEIKNKNL